MSVHRKNIVLVGLLVEGFLATIFFVWVHLKGLTFPLAPSKAEIFAGIVSVLPLLVLNGILFGVFAKIQGIFSPFLYLRDEIIKPLADELGPFSALLLACFAGFGEELFFRGMMQVEIGVLVTNFLFALLHFGTAVRKFFLVALVYFGIGLYFSFINLRFDSLWVPILTHAFYDYLVIMFMKYFYKR